MKDIAEVCISVIRIEDGRKTWKEYSIKTATEIYGEKLAVQLLGNQKSCSLASIVTTPKRNAEQDTADEEFVEPVDQIIRHQSGPRRFGDPVKEEEKSRPRKSRDTLTDEERHAKEEEDRRRGNVRHEASSNETGLTKYLRVINNDKLFPKLGLQEQYTLAKRWREHGDYNARNKLVTSHLPRVAQIAERYRGYGRRLTEDMISEGVLGLMRALDNFDPEMGFTLAACAEKWIEGVIKKYVMWSRSLIKMGTTDNQRKLFFSLQKEKSRINVLHYDDMGPDEVKTIAKRLGVKEREVIEINRRLGGDVPLTTYDKDGNEIGGLIDRLADDSNGDHQHDKDGKAGAWWFGCDDQEGRLVESEQSENRRKAIDQALGALDDRKRRILEARQLANEPTALKELAQEFGISLERVRQIEESAFNEVQKTVKSIITTMENPKTVRTLTSRWYEVRVYSNSEHEVAKSIRKQSKLRGLSHLVDKIVVPKEKVIEVRHGCKVETERKFRPGYVLVKMELTDEVRTLLKGTPKVAIKNKLMPLSDDEVNRIFRQIQKQPKPLILFKVGDPVRIVDGPFATFTGIIEEVNEARLRLKVALDGAIIHRVNLGFEQVVHHGG